ncbi:MAG: hypothetical protein AB1894_19760 [Chloroflexota bacterium]
MAKKQKTCINCHFLSVTHQFQDSTASSSATGQQRKAIRQHDFSAMSFGSLGCHFSVWNESSNLDPDQRYENIVNRNRKDNCFFWEHKPEMLIPAAEELQRRETEQRAASKDRRLAILGLFIAAIALAADVIIKVIQLFR